MTYQEPNLELIDEWAEAWSYGLIKLMLNWPKEKGRAQGQTKLNMGKA